MKKDSLHILISTAWYKNNQYPNAGSFVEEQARMFSTRGHKVSVLHPFLMGRFFDNSWNKKMHISTENDDGIHTIRIGIPPVLPKVKRLSYQKLIKKCINYLADYIEKEGKPDIIHSHSFFMGGLIGHKLSNRFNIPLFHTEHASSLIVSPKEYYSSDKTYVKKGFSKAKKVFFVSSFSKEKTLEMIKYKGNNTEVLPNVVDSYFFQTPLKKVDESSFKYLIIGNFDDNKNQALAIDSFAEVLKECPNSTLTIVGNGKYKKDLHELANNLSIEDKIVWKEDLTRDEVKVAISNTDVMLSCSKIETFGLTIAEGMACGKPCVVTNSGGINDFVKNENGIISQLEVNSFANCMIEVQENYQYYDSKKIRSICEKLFSEKTIYNKILRHYTYYLSQFTSNHF